MSTSRTARRAVAITAAAFLVLGGSAVAAGSAFADTSSSDSAASFTLTDNGAGSYSLLITIPGTSIAVDYAVDATGAITSATTSTAGASVTVSHDELTITLADGTVVSAEVGQAGRVDEVGVEQPDPAETADSQGGDQPDAQESDSPDAPDAQQSDAPDAPEVQQSDAPDVQQSDAPDAPSSPDSPDSSATPDSGSSD